MKPGLVFPCWLLAVGALLTHEARARPAPVQPPPRTMPAVLRWNNGENVTGEAVEATQTDLTWKTPLFEDPLLLAWQALHRIDQELPSSAPVGEFRFTLRDGSHLYGDLAGISADTVTIHSARHGDTALQRAEVLSACRFKGKHLVFDGPLGDSGWTPTGGVGNADTMPQLRGRVINTNTPPPATLGNVPTQLTGPGGALVLPFWDRAAALSLPLPERMDVEFRLHSKDRPAFQFALDGGANQRLRVETWGDELVLTAADAFESIRKIDDKEREISLRICWDQQTRHCQVYTTEGRLLKEWTVPEEKTGNHPAVELQNKGRELSLDELRVRDWDGQPLREVVPDQPRVQLDDGRVIAGTVSEMAGGIVTVPAASEESAASFAVDEVDTVIFSSAAPSLSPRATTLTYADGTFLQGEIAGIKEGAISLKTSFTEAPLLARIGALRQVFLRGANSKEPVHEPALKTLDKLTVQGVTLHGQLVATTGDAFVRWLPVGGKRPALPARTLPIEMTRAILPGAETPEPTTLFYTRMGDALPGVLHGLDRAEVDFESPMVEVRKLPAGEWRAVQFNVSDRGTIRGFNAAGWQVIKGDKAQIRKKDDAMDLTEGSTVGHPAALLNGEMKFTLEAASFAGVRLRMFCDGANPARALNYILFRQGNSMYMGVEAAEGQVSGQNRTATKPGAVVVRLVIDDQGVRFFLDDVLAETVPFPAARRAGAGLLMEPASLWGNSVEEVKLSNFTANLEPGQSLLQDVNADAKTQALTVPRFRKEDLPRHALMAANGDLLRGEIEAVTNTQFGFRIGLETLRVPRDRVTAVIALQKPLESAPTADPDDAVRKLLERSVDQQTWYSATNFNNLINLVKRAVPELKFKLPEGQSNLRQAEYHFNDEPVGVTIDRLCELFDLRYRIEKGVVIIEEKSKELGTGLVKKAYWLNSDAFPNKGTEADVLASKGIEFPGGASARWLESSRCLEVTNTTANQEKLANVLARDFGGVVASPTHWLLLTNGGRIGLTVEKFEPDAITGTHPVYGHCKVPMSEVYTIRNTLPNPTVAGRAVNGWKLAYAPEPVLPETGGEGSALLGKAAPVFKLKMLEGGDFDLDQQKGCVVILDFWATWCAPCINSLPGLIETMAQFPAERVKLVGLNQAEAPEQVKRFLETRGWKLAVAMDAGQNVARQYGADSIPHTVIVGPDGKVAWVKTGYSPDAETEAAEVVKKLLLASNIGTPTKDGASSQ